ncbi:MAG: hypothetical protein Q9168_006834 [Polycauliona sp. 1 TL-2023]
MAHSSMVLREWERLEELLQDGQVYSMTGKKLSLGAVVAVSRYRVPVDIDENCLKTVAASSAALMASLDVGQIIYGVNTGFGGSADSRTKQVEELQRTLIRELHYGIGPSVAGETTQRATSAEDVISRRRKPILESLEHLLPNVWVRASILVRINSLIAGHSGVRQVVVQRLSQLLNRDILPMIPLRGSISASGDLSPLSYIAGTIQGKPTVRVRLGSPDGSYSDTTAAKALATADLASVKLAAKEGLAIVNGTAVSAGVASLALWESHQLAVVAQLLTCMSVEALCGTDESFDPLFGQVRPHPGQIDCSNNMFRFLEHSQLVHHNDGDNDVLRQDRYSIRTASQWLGPALEDLLLAQQQVQIELNSVTDNPIIDTANGRMLHGGNFQAKAITSAMEKVRQAIQSIGRMLFSQCTELINPATNRGLPPNLTAEDPSSSFVMKAVDIMTAALQSELGFLANPVGSHVQTAEMGNQSLNSLALISARYTHTAVDVLTQLTAAHLFALCQALDLRAMNIRFLERLEPQILGTTRTTFAQETSICFDDGSPAMKDVWAKFLVCLEQTTKLDADIRFVTIMESLQPVLIRHLDSEQGSSTFLASLGKWTATCSSTCLKTFEDVREEYAERANATPYLGVASRRLYTFVRDQLQVPFLRPAHIRTPYPEVAQAHVAVTGDVLPSPEPPLNTVGSYVSAIHAALRSGELYGVAMECLRDAQESRDPGNTAEQV